MTTESNHHRKVTHHELKQTLGTWQLWGIAVGLVISGEYFGWSYGWASAGTLGFVITALFIAAMYTTFVFSFTELTTSIPHAGGPFAYARHAFGPVGGYLAGAATLVEFVFAPPAIALAIGVMVFAGAAGDWTKLANINDPLPQAMKYIVGANSGWMHMLVWLGLFGLVASFHGIILGYSRQIFALARAGYLPEWLAKVHPRFKTPHRAILAGGVVGIAAIYSDELIQFGGQTLTANIVTMSVFGAIVMYIVSMLALFRLRRTEPDMERPFKAPLFPYFPAFALVAAAISLATMVYYNFLVAIVFAIFLALGYVYFLMTRRQREIAPADALLEE
ncbi:amino acid permease [Trinickia terrae]|uniref:Amino acid permease n=1 Tax=Trinickia terrae TaxID=2571161 RepID=A0A4V5PJ34_9BURK|nr:amino acid permease [Trinickia terrae]TKC89200.1 amino acid permease [Trinickia terrae]